MGWKREVTKEYEVSSLKMKTADVIERFLPAAGHEYKTVHLMVGIDKIKYVKLRVIRRKWRKMKLGIVIYKPISYISINSHICL